MNFQQLEYVLALAEHKHFGLAAESCHITQATLSAMIIKLEKELGLLLFDRSRKPIKTTDVGMEFIVKARNIIREKESLYQFKTTSDHLQGHLRIGIIPTVANSLLPLILPPILADNPDLKMTVSEITTEDIKQSLIMDKIDIGILATPIDEADFDEHIMYYEPMMVYGVSETKKNYVSSADVKDKTIWLLEEGPCFRNQAITICEIQEKKMTSSNLSFKGSSFATLLNLTDKFGGYTLLPELYFNELSPEKKAITKHFKKPIPVREISMITYRHYPKDKTIQYLSKIIQESVKDMLSTKQYKNKDLEIIGI